MLWVALLVCEVILEVFGLYDNAVGIVSIKNNFDMKIIVVLVLYYNLILNMVDCGLKVIVALGLLMGPKEVSCYIWAVVFPIANCFRFCATMFISIIRLMSILVKKYQLECSDNWKLVALAFLVGPFLVCSVAASVAILPVQTIQGIGVYWCMVSSVYEQFKVLNLRSDTFGKRSYKLAILPDYTRPGILCLALPPHREVPKLDFQNEFTMSKIIQIFN